MKLIRHKFHDHYFRLSKKQAIVMTSLPLKKEIVLGRTIDGEYGWTSINKKSLNSYDYFIIHQCDVHFMFKLGRLFYQ